MEGKLEEGNTNKCKVDWVGGFGQNLGRNSDNVNLNSECERVDEVKRC